MSDSPNTNSDPKPAPPVSDSPWFYVLVFSLTALLALVAISGKYGRRQANIEVKYQARERIAEQRAAGGAAESQGNIPAEAERTNDSAARRPFATPGATLVPIWPLAVILVVVALFAYVMLYRARASTGPPCDESPPP